MIGLCICTREDYLLLLLHTVFALKSMLYPNHGDLSHAGHFEMLPMSCELDSVSFTRNRDSLINTPGINMKETNNPSHHVMQYVIALV